GKFAEADPLFLQAVGIWENTLGPDHPDLVETLRDLVGVLKSQ
ncbi:unnamed protein product, partial [Scytosiphon promiscuus]